jgi:D-alanyl-D-alanine carboxypeptidase
MLKAATAFVFASFAVPAFAQGFDFDRVNAVVEAAGFDGDIAVSDDPEVTLEIAPRYTFTGALPEPWRGWPDGLTWRWASVTKQMVAILVMQQVEQGTLALDEPIATYLPDFASANANTATIRHLLQHRAGLPNPESSDDGSGNQYAFYEPDFQGSRDPLTGFCAGPVLGEPGGEWTYNNCDYIVLGAVLEAVTGLSWDALFKRDIAEPLKLEFIGAYPGEQYTRWGFLGEEREPERDLSIYGASAGLYGEVDALIKIDAALMRGDLLGKEALAQMWDGDPALGFMALGQWVFTVPLQGCADPVRIVERRGDIGAVQVRNFILPDKDIAVAAFSQRKPFEFGEVWMGQGFSYDLLSAAACPTSPDK